METKKYDARTDNYIEARLRRYPLVKTKQDKKVNMTYREFISLAMKHYKHGGCYVAEYWTESDFNDDCARLGSMTEERALGIFQVYARL